MPNLFRLQSATRNEENHRERARTLGLWLSTIVIVATTIGLGMNLYWGDRIRIINNVVVMASAITCIVRTLRSPARELAWGPLYWGGYLGTAVMLAITGGIYSPFLTGYLLLLFLVGIVIQDRFSAKQVTGFVLGNLLFWTIATPLFHLYPSAPLKPLVVELQNILVVIATVAVLLSIRESGRKMEAREARQRELLEQSKAELAQAAKMAEIGTLLSTTAHELAQPVQVITLSSSLLRRLSGQDNPDPKLVGTFVANIIDASSRLNGLLTSLKDLARRDSFAAEPFDLREAVSAVGALMQLDLRNRMIRFSLELPPEPLTVHGDSLKIQQILLNLINNARDCAARSTDPEVQVRIEEWPAWVRVLVRNTGPVIPLEAQDKIFETYFTTKRKGEGTGLGLTVCSELIRQHGGRIYFCSEPDNTLFLIDLPRPGTPGLRIEAKLAPKESRESHGAEAPAR